MARCYLTLIETLRIDNNTEYFQITKQGTHSQRAEGEALHCFELRVRRVKSPKLAKVGGRYSMNRVNYTVLMWQKFPLPEVSEVADTNRPFC